MKVKEKKSSSFTFSPPEIFPEDRAFYRGDVSSFWIRMSSFEPRFSEETSPIFH